MELNFFRLKLRSSENRVRIWRMFKLDFVENLALHEKFVFYIFNLFL